MSILQCETCSGLGELTGKLCTTCKGVGVALVDDHQVLVFGKRLNRLALRVEKVRKVVRTSFEIFVGLVGLFGVVALVAEVFPEISQLFSLAFWQSAGRGKIIFAFTLFSDLYLVVRFLRRDENKEEVVAASKIKLKVAPRTLQEVLAAPKKYRREISRAFGADAQRRIEDAYRLALSAKHAEVLPAHLLGSLLGSGVVGALFSRLEVDAKGLNERLLNYLREFPKVESETRFGALAKTILLNAYFEAQNVKAEEVHAYHVLLETIKADERLQEILYDLGVELQQFKNTVKWFEINDTLRARWQRFRGAAARRPKGTMNRAMTALQTRILDRFSDDLTMLAGRGYLELTVDREQDFEAVFRVLQGERKSILLIGEYGIGKEAILNGIAQRMVEEEEVPDMLKDRRLVSVSIPKLVAGASPSEAGERLLACFNDVARARNVVLALPNVHELQGAGRTAGVDLGEMLASELGKGYFLAIATTTPEEYRAAIEGTALGNTFIPVEIDEPDVQGAIYILESKIAAIEYQTQVYFSYHALEKTVELSDKYLKERVLPEKAIDIAKETAQHVRNRRGAKALTRGEDVAEIVSQKSHVPVTSVTETEADKLLNLEKVMHERLVGQDEAVKAIAAALRRARAGLREGKRPIANFLFLGPTGVGKTETAKTVAEVYFGNEENMIRLDMSEYQDKTGVTRLLGAPGEKGGLLTEAVRKSPFALVLLDEIEKAHPDILNIFLQVMDDGRATDSSGRVVDFTNTILIATSNAGTQFIQDSTKQGKSVEEVKRELMERELKQYFKPEFLNRFDGIVVYKPLTEPEIQEVARRMLLKVAKQLESKGITFRATDEAVAELAHAGFDPQFGARPLRRAVQERVDDALANLLLTKKIGRRDVVILEKGGILRVEKAEKL